jgi:hypothetical protein
MAKAREEKRKMDYYQKKDYHERLRAQAFAEQEKDREMKNRENFLMEQKRQLALQATKEKEEMDKEMMLQKFDNDAKFVEQLNQVRGKEHALLKEKENLNKQLKQENVERIKRIQEYKRLETLKKISEGDKRTEEMMRRKEEIIQQRRIAGLKTKMQKDEIMSVLESSRANGSRAIKMLTQVLKEEPAGGKKKKKVSIALRRGGGRTTTLTRTRRRRRTPLPPPTRSRTPAPPRSARPPTRRRCRAAWPPPRAPRARPCPTSLLTRVTRGRGRRSTRRPSPSEDGVLCDGAGGQCWSWCDLGEMSSNRKCQCRS